MQEAPLDMRMNQEDDFTAYDVVNTYDADELKNIICKYGEERWASRIADFVVKARKDKPIETTGQLVDIIIKAAIPASARRDGPHPAKRTFQAIRIEVNDELGQLERSVDEFCDVLAPGGRLCIITFHSLEDRIVKDIINRRINPLHMPLHRWQLSFRMPTHHCQAWIGNRPNWNLSFSLTALLHQCHAFPSVFR